MSLQSLARAAAPTLLAALALATPASASTIGQTSGGSGFSCSAGEVILAESYRVPAAGTVTSFSLQNDSSSAGEQVDLLVLRKVPGTGSFTVVGKSGTQTLDSSGAVQTFQVTPIVAQAGDVLGEFNVTDHSPCSTFVGFGNGETRSATFPQSDPDVGSTVSTNFISSVDALNLAANFVPVTGSGNTAGTPVNAFSFDTSAGTVTFSDGTLNYNGTITCTNIVGNAATIVSIDNTRGKGDRLMAQDNGTTGDKLINTMFDLHKLSPVSLAKAKTCITPDTAALAAKRALDGDAIQIAH